MSESFRDIVFSCFRGLGALKYLVSVFVIFFYSSAYAAHSMFQGVNYDDDLSFVSFKDFSSSCLTMAQVSSAVYDANFEFGLLM